MIGVAEQARAKTRSTGGLADKRRAVISGALTIFARDGYTRASIDTIAAQAGVSSRTIYNHFQDKAELFQSVIQESAAQVADAQLAIIESYFRKVTDLEADLVEFGQAWTTPMPDYADHSALVRQINAEAGHIPARAIEAWQQVGPRRVLQALAERFGQLAERGLLQVDDPERAAHHFAVLITVPSPSLQATALSTADRSELVVSGVRVFLNGYRS